MASELDICNDALAMLGDSATVSSIDPPEGSAQADHCARFYPKARNALLEMHDWNFATARGTLTRLAVTPPSQWAYVYALPNGVVAVRAVLDSSALDDYSQTLAPMDATSAFAESVVLPVGGNGLGVYEPQPYSVETLEDGTQVIYTNQEDAVVRYTRLVEDTSTFPPLFVEALTVLLASKLAGSVIKGSDGRAAAAALRQEFLTTWLPRATTSDANQRRTQIAQQVAWMVGR